MPFAGFADIYIYIYALILSNQADSDVILLFFFKQLDEKIIHMKHSLSSLINN